MAELFDPDLFINFYMHFNAGSAIVHLPFDTRRLCVRDRLFTLTVSHLRCTVLVEGFGTVQRPLMDRGGHCRTFWRRDVHKGKLIY
jgi:hypothetical protein